MVRGSGHESRSCSFESESTPSLTVILVLAFLLHDSSFFQLVCLEPSFVRLKRVEFGLCKLDSRNHALPEFANESLDALSEAICSSLCYRGERTSVYKDSTSPSRQKEEMLTGTAWMCRGTSFRLLSK